MQPISLNGAWGFRFADEPVWQTVPVPGCWQAAGWLADRAGPALYRTHFQVPPLAAGQRLWLRFGAVSYSCVVRVNGQEVGRHIGLWDGFSCEISAAVLPGGQAELLVEVEKPAGLTAGPDSPALPGRFALRETLSGFLPYVWGQIFGGIWQDVTLAVTGPAAFSDAYARGDDSGALLVAAEVDAAACVTLELSDPAGVPLGRWQSQAAPGTPAQFALQLADPQPWSPSQPTRYTAQLSLPGGDQRVLQVGLRSLRADGATILLNGQPIYPRMVLSWGWYAESLHSNPGPAQVRADLLRLKQLGYNGVKLCLWVPPPYYFALADELGMLLWLELPMWIPQVSPHFRAQLPIEYARIVRQVRSHPALIIYTLGCELNRAVGDDLLAPLYAQVRQLAGQVLVRDNSGSGEAYGGLLAEHADFYDHHFYCDLPFLRQLLDTFTPRWRPAQPWLFGEFCDYDTLRVPPALLQPRRPRRRAAVTSQRRYAARRAEASRVEGAVGDPAGMRPRRRVGARWPQPRFYPPARRSRRAGASTTPWWYRAAPQHNPQGARWQYDLPYQAARLRANGYARRMAALRRLSEQHALLHRKWTLELVRSYREVAGYVVTGEVDTPIATAGMWDERRRLKLDPARLRSSNADTVLLLGWDRRRTWQAGGDRTAFWDVWCYPAGATIRPHLLISHYGSERAPCELRWEIGFEHEPPSAEGFAAPSAALAPGTLAEVAVAEWRVPEVARPRRAMLRASAQIGGTLVYNEWPLWLFPRRPWASAPPLALVDPLGRLADLTRLVPRLSTTPQPGRVLVASAWTPEVAAFVEQGGAALLAQPAGGPAGPLPTVALPFWREALRIVEPHPAWGDFPHGDLAGLQFFGCATDHALDTAGLPVRPILRRLDTRTMQTHDYVAELAWGAGRLIVTTLRLEGGYGEQPSGLAANVAAGYLLRCLVGGLEA